MNDSIQRIRPNAIQLANGYRETKMTQTGMVTLSMFRGKFVVEHGHNRRAFANLEPAQRYYDSIDAGRVAA